MLRGFWSSLRLSLLVPAVSLLAFSVWPLRDATGKAITKSAGNSAAAPIGNSTAAGNNETADAPVYTADGQLRFPDRYREWIYLTSGLDMSYSPPAGAAGHAAEHSRFDNLFVNRSSYAGFRSSGRWPDGTQLVLELRGAETGASINRQGKSQSAEILAIEVHVKDARLPGGWGFFAFRSPGSLAKLVPRSADCYSCHEQHAAVDTTFVQFYPTLLGVATAKQTLSPMYRKEAAGRP